MSKPSPRFLFLLLIAAGFSTGAFASPPMAEQTDPRVRSAIGAQKQVTREWMKQREVLGTAVTLTPQGETALAVYVDRDAGRAAEVVRSLPQRVENVPVEVHFSDRFRAMRRARPSKHKNVGISHSRYQAGAIQLGTSGGWNNDANNSFCCGGTLGALIWIGSQQYILSNYHVLEQDIVPGPNGYVAATGDDVLQPGLIDTECSPDGTTVATLEVHHSLPDNNVDCAVARVVAGAVRTDGAILEVGTISSQTTTAFINQAVKKSGRTTGLTHASVIGLNATITVDYENGCAGGFAFSKTFTGQIVVSNSRSSFVKNGDSGSLLLEDVATNPRAVGLLFAASSTDSIANPIDDVLAFFGATMVGN